MIMIIKLDKVIFCFVLLKKPCGYNYNLNDFKKKVYNVRVREIILELYHSFCDIDVPLIGVSKISVFYS